jgi:thymidylate kinase
MFTVALVGPDGVGKTTVARRLEQVLPVRVKYLYMGVNWDASNHLLPTTRLMLLMRRTLGFSPDRGGPPEPSDLRAPSSGAITRTARAAWTTLSLANRVAEEWYRQFVAWTCVRRGQIVIFDRHFYWDYYAHDVAPAEARTLGRRVHGFLLWHLYPRPDLVICLDAPPELLLARKGEGSIGSLERRRREYRELASMTEHFALVEAGRSLSEVTDEVAAAIQAFAARSRKGGLARPRQDQHS